MSFNLLASTGEHRQTDRQTDSQTFRQTDEDYFQFLPPTERHHRPRLIHTHLEHMKAYSGGLTICARAGVHSGFSTTGVGTGRERILNKFV